MRWARTAHLRPRASPPRPTGPPPHRRRRRTSELGRPLQRSGVRRVKRRMSDEVGPPVGGPEVRAEPYAFYRRAGPDLLVGALVPGGLDRKSVVSGKSVSVRVDPGGSRVITKKNK